jgi:uncharacterized protein
MTAGRIETAGLPPVESWNPAFCGDSRMRIARDGRWFHEGAPIIRPELVRLFSGLLRLDAEGYMLVTPVEKLSIAVEDVPFQAVAVDVQGGDLVFTTNVGDRVLLDDAHGLRMAGTVPYLHVRRGLEARVTRPVYYQLAEMAVAEGGRLGVSSGGRFFVLGDMDGEA